MIWLMALVLSTNVGQVDAGVLHDKQGRPVRFPTKESCEAMAAALMRKANEQNAAGKLNPAVTGAQFVCYQPTAA